MKYFKLCILILYFASLMPQLAHAQYLPVSNDYEPLYEFLEELRADNYIDRDQFAGPLSEMEIAVLLRDAVKNHRLPLRIKNEIGHYQREFMLSLRRNRMAEEDIDIFRGGLSSLSLHPMGYYWGDAYNTFSIKPIAGAEWTLNNDQNSFYYHKGLRLTGNLGGFAYYAKIHDQTYTTVYNQARYINNVRNYSQTAAFVDMLSGGVSYSNDYLLIGFFHDKSYLGNSINSPLLISHRSPTYSRFNLDLTPNTWLRYKFMLAHLGDIDQNQYDLPLSSNNRFTGTKLLLLNQIEVKPIPTLGITIGQLTTVVQDAISWYNYLPFNYYRDKPATDPVLYYHLNLSSIPHLDLSFTHFFERISTQDLTDKLSKNKAGVQTRAVLSNWPIQNIILKTEYTYASPFALSSDAVAHQHNGYPLGWYLGDHSDQFYLEMTYKPVSSFQLKVSYNKMRKGNYETIDLSTPNLFTPFESLHWQSSIVGFQFRHQTSYFTEIFAGIYSYSREGDEQNFRTAPFFQDRTYSFNVGVKIGY